MCTADNHNYMCHICTKGFVDSNFNEAVIAQISNLKKKKKNAPDFTFSQKL